MTVVVARVCGALKGAGAFEERARNAAAAVAAHETRFDGTGNKLTRIEGETSVLPWRTGTVGAVRVLVKLLPA